jgi:hypothetical protein
MKMYFWESQKGECHERGFGRFDVQAYVGVPHGLSQGVFGFFGDGCVCVVVVRDYWARVY